MILKKNLISGFLFFLGVLCCCGERFNALSDEDAGRLLYWSNPRKHVILVFQKRLIRANHPPRWQCAFFRDTDNCAVYPKDCHLLDYKESEITYTCTSATKTETLTVSAPRVTI